MINAVLSDKLKWAIRIVFFKHSNCTFWESYAQAILLGVCESNKISGVYVFLIVTSSIDIDLMIFVDWNIEYFWNKLNLFLGRLVQGY